MNRIFVLKTLYRFLSVSQSDLPGNLQDFGEMQETPRITALFSVAPAIYHALRQNAGKNAMRRQIDDLPGAAWSKSGRRAEVNYTPVFDGNRTNGYVAVPPTEAAALIAARKPGNTDFTSAQAHMPISAK